MRCVRGRGLHLDFEARTASGRVALRDGRVLSARCRLVSQRSWAPDPADADVVPGIAEGLDLRTAFPALAALGRVSSHTDGDSRRGNAVAGVAAVARRSVSASGTDRAGGAGARSLAGVDHALRLGTHRAAASAGGSRRVRSRAAALRDRRAAIRPRAMGQGSLRVEPRRSGGGRGGGAARRDPPLYDVAASRALRTRVLPGWTAIARV